MKSGGFTLIEVMIVLAVVGLLMALIGPSLRDKWVEAQVKTATIQMKGFESALTQFYLHHSFFPSTEQGLVALVERPTQGRTVKHYPRKGYLKGGEIPPDPWGESYRYQRQHYDEYKISSSGPDAEWDTEDDIVIVGE